MPLPILDTAAVCAQQCRAQCCRGASYLRLSAQEAPRFAAHAQRLGVAWVGRALGDGAAVRFLEQPGERCPMLDPQTARCRIYSERPARCRSFPERRRDGCALSQALHGEDATARASP